VWLDSRLDSHDSCTALTYSMQLVAYCVLDLVLFLSYLQRLVSAGCFYDYMKRTYHDIACNNFNWFLGLWFFLNNWYYIHYNFYIKICWWMFIGGDNLDLSAPSNLLIDLGFISRYTIWYCSPKLVIFQVTSLSKVSQCSKFPSTRPRSPVKHENTKVSCIVDY